MEVKAYFSQQPDQIHLENHDDGNWVWLRKNIQSEEKHEGEDTYIEFSCDEVFLKTGATEEEIEADFDAYYEFGTTWEEETEPTLEERISAVEEVILELMG